MNETIVIKLPDLSMSFDLPGERRWHLKCPLSLVIAADQVQAETQGRGEPDEYAVLYLLPQAVADFGAPANLSAMELTVVLEHGMKERLRRQQAHLDELARLLTGLHSPNAPAPGCWPLQHFPSSYHAAAPTPQPGAADGADQDPV